LIARTRLRLTGINQLLSIAYELNFEIGYEEKSKLQEYPTERKCHRLEALSGISG
jgi:hypothetical protein